MTPSELHPEIISAQEVLLEAWRRELSAGASRVGWKVGHAIPEVQALAGDQPVVGYLTTATLLGDGDGYGADGTRALRAETEVVLELERGVGSGDSDSAIRQSIAAVGTAPRDPVAVIRDITRVLEACGERLAAGDRLLAGSVVHVPVVPGDRVTARIRGLGEASAHIYSIGG